MGHERDGSFCLVGMTGREPLLHKSSRNRFEAYPRSQTTQRGAVGDASRRAMADGSSCACPGVRVNDRAFPRPLAAAQTLLPKPPRERSIARQLLQFFRPPLFDGPCRLVMRLDVRAVEKDHAQGWIPVFHLLQECLPHTELRPANEQLSCGPSGAELRRKRSPFRAVLVTPEHRRYRQAQVAWRCCFAFGSLRLDQRLPNPPRIIRNHRLHHAHHKKLCRPTASSRPNRP